MSMRRRLFMIGFGALLLAPLGACGRRSLPKAPEGSTYPREYPTPSTTGARGRSEPPPEKSEEPEIQQEPLVPSAFPTYNR